LKTAKITKGDIARITLTVCQCAAEWRQRPPLAFVLEEDILSTCCNKNDVM